MNKPKFTLMEFLIVAVLTILGVIFIREKKQKNRSAFLNEP